VTPLLFRLGDPAMGEVTLEPAGPERAETLANLFQLYVHDFADFWMERRVEFGEDGRFPLYPPLPSYWTDPDRSAFLIRAGGAIAGFVLLDGHSHAGEPTDANMGEFFVARHYRREGVGRAAALAAIGARPGQWEIAVARHNTGAQPFWRGVAAAAASGEIDERDQDDAAWNGLILRFRVG
jgi:predicted acetyltransferase